MNDSARPALVNETSQGNGTVSVKHLIAISYAADIEETAARLDRGLVELLGGAADRVFFALRSPLACSSDQDVKQGLRGIYERAHVVVLLWSPGYDKSEFTEIERLTGAESLLDKATNRSGSPNNSKPYIYTVAVSDPGVSAKIPFDAYLIGRRWQPMWKVAEDIIAKLDALMGPDFALRRSRERVLVRWDPPAYHALVAQGGQPDCNNKFDCHRAFAASCEAGELYCLAAQVAAQLISLASEAQTAALANPTAGPQSQQGLNAFRNLIQACKGILRVFMARHDHLQAMISVRGDKAAKGMLNSFGRISKDLEMHQADRLRDFLNRHLPTLGEDTTHSFCETVLNVAGGFAARAWNPQRMNEDANMLISWSTDIAGLLADFTSQGRSVLQMGHPSESPPSAARAYADDAKANLVLFV